MRRKPYPFVHEFLDRHGRPRVYLRKPGHKRVALPWPIGSREFIEAYQAALADASLPIAAGKTKPGSVSALVVLYYASAGYGTLAPQSKRVYRGVMERLRTEHGDKLVAHLQREHVRAMVNARTATPSAANQFRKVLRLLMRVAIDAGWRLDDPTAGVKPIKSKSTGFRTWTEEDIAQYEARHAVDTTGGLAFALLLYTGQRRSDVVRMGRQHIRQGVLTIRQQKTGVEVSIPVHPRLQECLAAAPREHLTFLVTEYGKPFTAAGFTGWFRARCAEAGLPVGLSPHGLRKAMCTRLAEAGCSAHEIMAISGHKTLTEVSRYTEAANRKRLAGGAMRSIGRLETRTAIGKPD